MLNILFLVAIAVAAYGIYHQYQNTDPALPVYQRVWQSAALFVTAAGAWVQSWFGSSA